MSREAIRGTIGCVALVAVLVFGALPAGCSDEGTPCNPDLCWSGSKSCCPDGQPGEWDPAIAECWCTASGTDADADGDDDAGADADADGDVEDEGEEAEAVDPCFVYPCGPYGMRLGNVWRDQLYTPVNDTATEFAGADGELSLDDFFAMNEAHGGAIKALFVFVTAVWCPACAQEAAQLQSLYVALQPLGVEFLGIVTDGPTPGTPATLSEGRGYATRYRWTFATVIDTESNVQDTWWPPADRANPDGVGVPLNLVYDLRNMRLYGRASGALDRKLLDYAIREIVTDPRWTPAFARDLSFNCAPGTGTETEPNSLGETPENGTTLPFALSGVQCPPTLGDGLLLDEDTVDLGTLAPGATVDASVAAGTDSSVYPLMLLATFNGTNVDVVGYGPCSMTSATPSHRQWVIDTPGHYYLAVFDGRAQSITYYGGGAVPLRDSCCDGGPGFTYDLSISPYTLATTDAAVTTGTSIAFSLDTGDLNVHPFDVTADTTYAIRMISSNTALMNPYLTVWDPATSTVVAFNDDESFAGGNYNSVVTITPTTTGTLWLVAGYSGLWFSGTSTYTFQID
jgi:peroxiredoxin